MHARLLLFLAATLAACTAGSHPDPSAGGSTVVVAPTTERPSPAAPEPPPSTSPAPLPIVRSDERELELLDACATLKPPGPVCPTFESSQAGCAAFAHVMVPAAAEAATACMLAKSGTKEMCIDGGCAPGDPMCSDLSPNDLVNRCLQRGIGAATRDPAHLPACQTLAAKCALRTGPNPALQLTCVDALSAMKPEHTHLLLECLESGCSLDYCGFELSFASRR